MKIKNTALGNTQVFREFFFIYILKNFFGYFPPDMMFKHNDTFKRVFENLWSAAGNDIFQFAALWIPVVLQLCIRDSP